jgi:hypothetical protein
MLLLVARCVSRASTTMEELIRGDDSYLNKLGFPPSGHMHLLVLMRIFKMLKSSTPDD